MGLSDLAKNKDRLVANPFKENGDSLVDAALQIAALDG
jgi:hypothetical protein